FPNVGKSSVINSLKRRKCCQTGALPGLTRQLQEVEARWNDAAELSLRNAVRVDSLVDPISPVNAILRRCSIKTLMLHYGIPQFDDCDQFLALLSRRFGRLKKGGRPNLIASAKQVLKDWNSGKLRYYTEPPEQTSPGGDNNSLENATEIVAAFSKEFDSGRRWSKDIRVLVDGWWG
uniref:Guanine nucleotide-binding protein-like 3 homolog n=1 Tax=Globodera pallida TaxID=36090 RepID=A0A183CTJ9_GLOPA